MENRSVFAFNGVSGMLVAVVLLLSILGVLTYFAIVIQQDVANKPYTIENINQVKMISTDNASHVKVKE
ncbi:hypothetical protein LMG7974_00398 [Campylobacter majalis]|uniref:DUF4006 family protein n=1 Tax=Campylobacter majalis TaxID=2790656 RepID=A0ABM8Q3V5_9BACT|nr:DUF4006 family protein [Campylobacter majalis]CAD7287519.1 hypothetical protein LMG7974_00398 [Campylobacter majalis]